MDNKIDIEIEKVWNIELSMLDELDRVCKQLNLNYYLDSGTLLGAVRNNGFIPWDDDIDVVMFRKDYDKLLEYGSDMFSEPFFFQSPYTDIEYYRGHSQLRMNNTTSILPDEEFRVKFHQGIFLDIFPLDGIPQDPEIRSDLFKKKERLWDIINGIAYPLWSSPVECFKEKTIAMLRRIKYGSLIRLYDEYVDLCKQFEESEYVEKLTQRHSEDKIVRIKKEWYSETVMYRFEGKEYPIPNGYDDILKAFYGEDYMTPQKKDSLHGKTILYTDISYKEIIKEHRMNKRGMRYESK